MGVVHMDGAVVEDMDGVGGYGIVFEIGDRFRDGGYYALYQLCKTFIRNPGRRVKRRLVCTFIFGRASSRNKDITYNKPWICTPSVLLFLKWHRDSKFSLK